MGNVRWWDAQRDALAATHQIVTLDLAGHGAIRQARGAERRGLRGRHRRGRARDGSADPARACSSVTRCLACTCCSRRRRSQRLAKIVLVDTLKNLDQLPTLAQVEPMLAGYRASYEAAVRTMLPQYLFTPQTPPAVVERLTREFLAVTGDVASDLLAPLYRTDPREAARATRVPVRGIGGDGVTATTSRRIAATSPTTRTRRCRAAGTTRCSSDPRRSPQRCATRSLEAAASGTVPA